MNKVQLTGRLTKDVDIRVTQTNKKIALVDIAVKKNTKNANGEYESNFIRVHLWEQRAEYLSKYAQKGSLIGVTGSIETNNYTNKDGQKVYDVYVVADGVEILSQPQKQQQQTVTNNYNFGGTRSNSTENLNITQDELPFY